MSSIGSSGESLSALLALIADPATHKARLDEQLQAEAKAKVALTELAGVQDKISADRQNLNLGLKAHQKVIDDFAAERAAILAKAKDFDDREATVAQREDAAKTKEEALTAAKAEFDTMSTAKGKELIDREQRLADGEAMLRAANIDLAAGQKALEARMARLKELTQ